MTGAGSSGSPGSPRLRAAGNAFAIALIAGAGCAASDQAATDPRRSGTDAMSPALQQMQRDDSQNPGMLWVADGETAWQARPPGTAAPSCAGCHGAAADSMRGVAVRYPAWDERLGRPITLQQRIEQCRTRHQLQPALALETEPLLRLETYVAHQSRGLALAPSADPRLTDWRARGEVLFRQRIGQLNLSCSQCHDQRAGERLGGAPIPQAHPTGYPLYRLEWQAVGSLQRRLRNCSSGVRAEPFGYGSEAAVQLELYLAERARGMPLETPAIRP